MYNYLMRITLKKWGNSVGLRLPKVFLAQLGVQEQQEVELSITDNVITIKKPSVSLRELVAQITPENRHDEIDWGPPVGKEAW